MAPAVAELAWVTTDRCGVGALGAGSAWATWAGARTSAGWATTPSTQWFAPPAAALDSSFTEVRVVRGFLWIIAEA